MICTKKRSEARESLYCVKIYFKTFSGIEAELNTAWLVESLSLSQSFSQVRHVEEKEQKFQFFLDVTTQL